MKIVFNGIIETHTSGCGVCGKRKSHNSFVTTKTYILPSGVSRTFRAGQVQEVSERDGRFLLSYSFKDENGTRNAFTEVTDG